MPPTSGAALDHLLSAELLHAYHEADNALTTRGEARDLDRGRPSATPDLLLVVVAYEATKQRDIKQAAHLIRAIFNEDPHASENSDR